MSFGLITLFGFFAGIAALAVALWAIQRLRVQHREVEVATTLFWQEALKETRARVFVRRFRHWPAWLLLLAICSLLWMLFGQPEIQSNDSTQHVVLVDWSEGDREVRSRLLEKGKEYLEGLPVNSRELIAVDTRSRTMLSAGDDVYLASVRAEAQIEDVAGTNGLRWMLDALGARSTKQRPISIYWVSDQTVDAKVLKTVPQNVEIFSVMDSHETEARRGLRSLGFSNSASGKWRAVDVRFAVNASDASPAAKISLSEAEASDSYAVTGLGNDRYESRDVPANGQQVTVLIDGEETGRLTLPKREQLRIVVENGVPDVVQDLIALDESLLAVESGGDVTIGYSDGCDLQLSDQSRSAFEIEANVDDPESVMLELVDQLALTQVDATSLAQQTGEVIDVQVLSGPNRKISIWSSLLTPAFDFTQSRAYPIFFAKSIRWLADRPEEVNWAGVGERLPSAVLEFERIVSDTALTADGRELAAVRYVESSVEEAELEIAPATGALGKVSTYTWLGLLLSVLLVGEWALYQKGRMP